MTSTLAPFAKRVLDAARERNLSIVTAESCTAGMLSTLFSEVPRAGEQLHGGLVTYSKAAKTKLLGLSEVLLKQRGAVCADVAIAMAQGPWSGRRAMSPSLLPEWLGRSVMKTKTQWALCALQQSARAARRFMRKDTTAISAVRRFYRKRWRMPSTKSFA